MTQKLPEGLDTYLNVKHLKEALGISRAGLNTLIKSGEFPAGIKIGRSRKWGLSEVQAWIASKKQEAAKHETSAQALPVLR